MLVEVPDCVYVMIEKSWLKSVFEFAPDKEGNHGEYPGLAAGLKREGGVGVECIFKG